MINVTGGKDGEKVSVELIGSKDEVVREARYVIEAVAEKIFVRTTVEDLTRQLSVNALSAFALLITECFCHLR